MAETAPSTSQWILSLLEPGQLLLYGVSCMYPLPTPYTRLLEDTAETNRLYPGEFGSRLQEGPTVRSDSADRETAR